MNLRAKKSWLVWLLPLFILRAFVPVGFMLSWAGGELQMVVCAGNGPATVVQQASPSGHAAHADHAHHVQDSSLAADHTQHEHHGSKAHDGSYCPFAVAAVAGLPIVLQAFTTERPPLQTFDFIALAELRSAPILIDRIRGPPLA